MYEQPLQAAGAVGGSTLLGSLGRFLEPLDYPRRSLWNVPRKIAEGDFTAALPGLIGLGVGGAAALTGLGLPAAVALGSLAGGLGQGMGEAQNPERFAAPTPEDVTGSDNFLVNALVQMAGDPFMYASGLGSFKAGEMLASRLGGRMAEQATAHIPEEASTLSQAITHAVEPVAPWLDDPEALLPVVLPEHRPLARGITHAVSAPPVETPWLAEQAAALPLGLPEPAPPFYSRLQRAIEEAPGREFKTESLLKRLKEGKIGGQGPINPEEIQATGLEDLFAGRPTISKEEILRNVGQWGPDVKTTVKRSLLPEEEALLSRIEFELNLTPHEQQIANSLNDMRPRYGDAVLPGGENYREVLLQSQPFNAGQDYLSPHFNEPNVVAHLRTTERELPGAGKSLHAEEIQSDWHQAGKKRGYAKNPNELEEIRKEAISLYRNLREMDRGITPPQDRSWLTWLSEPRLNDSPETVAMRTRLSQLLAREEQLGNLIPYGPFTETWPDLALKKLMHDAAAGGFDLATWNVGDSAAKYIGGELSGQSQFYDKVLPKRANKLLQALGGGQVELLPLTEPIALTKSHLPPEEAMQEIGRHIVEQANRGQLTVPHGYSVDDLYRVFDGATQTGLLPRVEGFGLDANITDNIVLSSAGPASITPDMAHGIRITPALRQAILKGLPLMSLGAGAAGGGALLAALQNQGA